MWLNYSTLILKLHKEQTFVFLWFRDVRRNVRVLRRFEVRSPPVSYDVFYHPVLLDTILSAEGLQQLTIQSSQLPHKAKSSSLLVGYAHYSTENNTSFTARKLNNMVLVTTQHCSKLSLKQHYVEINLRSKWTFFMFCTSKRPKFKNFKTNKQMKL